MPAELIPTVLAHECGHIACHHCLYTTMGQVILSEAASYLGLSDLAVLPIKSAFSYWMRCSELSADRAAAICDGKADNVVEMCMRFAGLDKDIPGAGEASVDAFLEQAQEYRSMVTDSKWNRTLEVLFLSGQDHPMNAVRASECLQWVKEERFGKMLNFLTSSMEHAGGDLAAYLSEIPMPFNSKHYSGQNVADVQAQLRELGFRRVGARKLAQKGLLLKPGHVLSVRINGSDGFDVGQWFPVDAEVVVEFHEPLTEEEIIAAHPGQLRVPNSSIYYLGKVYQEVVQELRGAGFTNIEVCEQRKAKKGLLGKNDGVSSVSINGQSFFTKGDWFKADAPVVINYTTYAGGTVGWLQP